MEEEEKEPALQQELYILSFTQEEATGPPGKDPAPQNKNKGAGVEALLWHLYCRNTRRDPKETGRAQSQPKVTRNKCSKKNKSVLKVPQAGYCN